jgi:poly-gamma-glutamate synthesis protein (capsule biosynthesis protein)
MVFANGVSCSSSEESSLSQTALPTIGLNPTAETIIEPTTVTPTETLQVSETGGLIFDPDIPEWAITTIKKAPSVIDFLSQRDETVYIGFEETPYILGNIQYFLVTPFQTPITSLSLNEFNYIWSVDRLEDDAWDGRFIISNESESVLFHRWGEHKIGVTVVAGTEDNIIASMFNSDTHQMAILPAQYLRQTLRTVRINDDSFFQPGESLARSVFNVTLYSSQPLVEQPIPINFSMDSITTINITGVTALVRATAVLMRKNGNTYPAEQIIDILLSADYTHISNEVSFSPSCPAQQYTSDNLIFCSPIETFELLTYIDTDIVELTGDHLSDYGGDALLYTLGLYDQAGFFTYGGGENLASAQSPITIEHHGNRLAFLGCNAKNPSYARARENYPGTWHCDMELLKSTIAGLQAQNYIPIITIQHLENELNQPPDTLISDFKELSALAPVILIGSQSHVPKPFIVNETDFIHYGLGNLFFDQINESPTHTEAFIDRFVFYDNELLSVELFPIKFIDYAQSRPMTRIETFTFLSKVFELSDFTLP